MNSFLTSFIAQNQNRIKEWFATNKSKPALYCSFDIRNAGFKAVSVDANLFSAGFNNLTDIGRQKASKFFARYIASYHNGTKKILVIPENFTRNTKYFDNIQALLSILELADYEVVLGSPYFDSTTTITHNNLSIHPIVEGVKLLDIQTHNNKYGEWIPDLIILNNDLTENIPAALKTAYQPLLPDALLGWHARRKSNHISTYNEYVIEFAEEFKIDPWFFTAITNSCYNINFKEQQDLEKIASTINSVITNIQEKYKEYQITDEPYVFIKPNRGTFGMGIITLKRGDDIFTLNKKARNNVKSIKHGIDNNEIIIQEGVPTTLEFEGYPAEQMFYCVNGEIIEPIVRYNTIKNDKDSLNSKGMNFSNINSNKWSESELTAESIAVKLALLAVAKECSMISRDTL